MRTATFALAAVLVTSTAHATPVLTTTGGDWLPLPPACECGGVPWNGHSDDGHNHALAFVFEVLGLADGMQYFSGSAFEITEWAGVKFFGETAYANATLTESDGTLSYDDHVGSVFSSASPSGGAGYFALFRRPLSATEFRLYVGVNDTWEGDRDAQDGIYTMDIARPILTPEPRCVNCEPPPVGEPGTLALMGMVALGIARRMRGRA